MANNKYWISLNDFARRKTIEVNVGGTPLGGSNPIRVQTMTTTNTNDTIATAEQCIRAFEAGAEYVRITTQGVKEASNLENIKKELIKRGYNIPLVADIHFNPSAAIEAAKHVDKVRINPGNFVDSRAKFENVTTPTKSMQLNLQKLRKNLYLLLAFARNVEL